MGLSSPPFKQVFKGKGNKGFTVEGGVLRFRDFDKESSTKSSTVGSNIRSRRTKTTSGSGRLTSPRAPQRKTLLGE